VSVQLAMVGVIVSDMARALEFYRRLGLPIAEGQDDKRFVMHRMPSGVTIFFDAVFFPAADPARVPSPRNAYNIDLEFSLGTRDAVDATTAALAAHGAPVRTPPWKTDGPYASIVEDPDGNAILLTAEDASAELPG
jgi:catechol 2,3-dioxygenase-like lactoylglutathione lyase family enzyme